MLGAIIGDIVGSRFEFRNYHNKAFKLLEEDCFFTDDTVMTCAVADALLHKENKAGIVKKLQEYGRAFPKCSYGGRFSRWLLSDDPKPYNSWGNGAAMRISPVAYIAKNENEVKSLSKKVTSVTHNHPEGLKGAETVALCVFKALHGATKEQIKRFAIRRYPEIANMDYSWLNHNYKFNETCQGTVPQAIYCFLISRDFEDCLKTTVSIGGDSDTLCAISGAIAEAFYGFPKDLQSYIPYYFLSKKQRKLIEPVLEIYHKCGIKIGIKL